MAKAKGGAKEARKITFGKRKGGKQESHVDLKIKKYQNTEAKAAKS